LERQHYSPATIDEYRRCLTTLGQQMKALKVRLKDLTEERAVELIGQAVPRNSRSQQYRFIVRRFLQFLLPLGVVQPQPVATCDDTARGHLRRDYEAYLRRQRGLSESTIFSHCCTADRFLTFRFGQEVGELTAITAADIGAFLLHVTTRQPPLRDKALASRLRSFFQYLFQVGKTTVNLAVGIPSVAQRYGKHLPRHLTPAQVELLLEAVRTAPAGGRRNYAMVLLLARLGLRAPEVIALQLDDIDWRAGEILVRGKGQRHDRVPLPSDVGEALAAYLKQERVSTSRTLFVSERAPHCPFKDGQILNSILRTALARTGLTPPAPYVGSHMLRHSLATTLVQRGASLEEISDLLRHRSRASTLIYAKLDIEGLRSIAQPWPVAGGAK
jgi:site-specific recombinase XerD